MVSYLCCECNRRYKFDREITRLNCPISRCDGELELIGLGNEQPYLQITLDELDSVPKVIYKGEEIKLKQEVIFHWETDTSIPGGITIEIEHAEASNKHPKSKRIEERIKSHVRF